MSEGDSKKRRPRKTKPKFQVIETSEQQTTEQENDIDKELEKYHYTLIDKFITKDKSNNYIIYVKAITSNGYTTYILIENNENKNYQEILLESDPPTNIPFSIKYGSFESVGNTVHGVVIEHDNGFLVMRRDCEKFEPCETNFSFDKSSEPQNGLVIYPLICLCDITENKTSIEQSIDEVTRCLRNINYSQCIIELEKMVYTSQTIQKEYLQFYQKQRLVFQALSQSLYELQKLHDTFKSKTLKTESDTIRYETIIYNLRKRHEFVTELICLCQKVMSFSDTLTNISKSLEYFNEYLDKVYQGIRFVYERKK